MAVRKRANSWQYDFKLQGYRRQRKAGFKTRAEAREDLISGRKCILFADAYEHYLSATTMKAIPIGICGPRSNLLGHLFIEEVDTSAMDALKRALPSHLGPKSVNNQLALVRAVLRFCWKRGTLPAIPYVPTERAPKKKPDWYSKGERDRFLSGMFAQHPRRPAGHEGPAGDARDAQEQRGLCPRSEPRYPRRRPLACPSRICGRGVPVQERRDLPPLHRQLQAAHGGRATGTRASTP